jgi:cytochrome c-type biogenesis protein CcmH
MDSERTVPRKQSEENRRIQGTMSDPILIAAAAGVLATLAVVLAAALMPRNDSGSLLEAILKSWRALPAAASKLTLAGLVAGAASGAVTVAGFETAQRENPVSEITASVNSAEPALNADNSEASESALPEDSRERALSKLRDYASSIKDKQATIAGYNGTAASGSSAKALADVDTMIAGLVKRLEADPKNFSGWKMLGWSYLHTGQVTNAVAAYERALAIAPDNAEIKSALDDAKRGGAAQTGAPVQPLSQLSVAPETTVEATASTAGEAGQSQAAMINGMVARLADRLDANPNDEDGWLKLMKSRMVLGQRDLAREALRKALATFENSPAAKGRIAEAAKALGL